jgi:hypothetical protein
MVAVGRAGSGNALLLAFNGALHSTIRSDFHPAAEIFSSFVGGRPKACGLAGSLD